MPIIKFSMLISGSSSQELARKIAAELNEELIQAETKKFPDGELSVRIEQDITEPAVVIQSLNHPQNDNLVELLFILDLLALKGVKKIACVIPYYAYARQDKVFKKGELDSARTIAKILKDSNVSYAVTCDLHFQRTEGEFDLYGIPAYNVAAGDLLVDKAKQEFGDVTVITPDAGSAEQAKAVGGVSLSKERLTSFEVELSGEVDATGKNILLLDDMVTTGGTMIKALKLMKEKGAAKTIAAFTHAAFVGDASDRLKASADLVIAADTIPSEFAKVTVSEKIAEAIKKWKT